VRACWWQGREKHARNVTPHVIFYLHSYEAASKGSRRKSGACFYTRKRVSLPLYLHLFVLLAGVYQPRSGYGWCCLPCHRLSFTRHALFRRPVLVAASLGSEVFTTPSPAMCKKPGEFAAAVLESLKQGLSLVLFSAQPEPFLTLKPVKPPNVSLLFRSVSPWSRKVDECKPSVSRVLAEKWTSVSP
jgi:hypothetical protein